MSTLNANPFSDILTEHEFIPSFVGDSLTNDPDLRAIQKEYEYDSTQEDNGKAEVSAVSNPIRSAASSIFTTVNRAS